MLLACVCDQPPLWLTKQIAQLYVTANAYKCIQALIVNYIIGPSLREC